MINLMNYSYRLKNFFSAKFSKQCKFHPSEYSTIDDKGNVVPVQIEAYFLALNRYIDKGSSVLDVGFGLGYGLIISSIHAKNVYGIDVDRKALQHCMGYLKGRLPTLSNIDTYDGYHIPYDNDFFDVVICVDVIEHVENYHKLIDEMIRVSKKGVFLSTPNRRPEYTNPDGSPKNYWHLREWNYEEFNSIIGQHGKCEWHCINGPWDGPFTISDKVQENTMALSPFIYK